MKTIKFKTDKSGITIRIPRTLLNHVAKHNPESPVKVIDSQVMLEKVCEQLESELCTDNDSNSLTKFESLIDEAIGALVENGEDCVELKELD